MAEGVDRPSSGGAEGLQGKETKRDALLVARRGFLGAAAGALAGGVLAARRGLGRSLMQGPAPVPAAPAAPCTETVNGPSTTYTTTVTLPSTRWTTSYTAAPPGPGGTTSFTYEGSTTTGASGTLTKSLSTMTTQSTTRPTTGTPPSTTTTIYTTTPSNITATTSHSQTTLVTVTVSQTLTHQTQSWTLPSGTYTVTMTQTYSYTQPCAVKVALVPIEGPPETGVASAAGVSRRGLLKAIDPSFAPSRRRSGGFRFDLGV